MQMEVKRIAGWAFSVSVRREEGPVVIKVLSLGVESGGGRVSSSWSRRGRMVDGKFSRRG